MRLLIISDSHGQKEELKTVIDRHRLEVDAVIHCGDSELETDALELSETLTVKGNCDFSNFPEELVEKVNRFKVYITHGHLYNVKMSYVPLSYRAEEVGAKVVCFGHSHIATSFQENNIVYINPGSLRLPRQEKEATYVLCTADDKQIEVAFYTREGQPFSKLSKTYFIDTKTE